MIVEWLEDFIVIIILIKSAAKGSATKADLRDSEGCIRWAILKVTKGVALL